MLRVNMISTGQDVQGQGVGSAYHELVKLLENHAEEDIQLSFNDDKDADLNHVHTIHPLCFGRMQKSKKASCMHVHFLPDTLDGSIQLPEMFESIFYNYVVNFYQKADALIVVNPIFIDDLVSYGIAREDISYIPNVVASNDYYKKDIPADDDLREKFHAPKDSFNVLGVGQVQTRKGVLDFVKIAEAMPDINFIWAGGFSFGKITDGYRELEKVVENPPKNVHFLGIIDRDEMNDLYNMADCLLMTSYNELFPMAILEAVNVGIPILLRDLDLYEKIYFTDYLRAEDNEEFCKILNGLRTNPQILNQGLQASEDIAQYYSEENVVKQWIDYYHAFYEKYK